MAASQALLELLLERQLLDANHAAHAVHAVLQGYAARQDLQGVSGPQQPASSMDTTAVTWAGPASTAMPPPASTAMLPPHRAVVDATIHRRHWPLHGQWSGH